MALQASIDIYFEKLSFQNVMEKLSFEWDTNDFGKISYMDNDDFNWSSSSVNKKENILNILKKRFDNNKTIGVIMVNKKNRGGLFLFYPSENLLSIILNINRKKIENLSFTDYSYYNKKLNSILKENILKIEYSDII